MNFSVLFGLFVLFVATILVIRNPYRRDKEVDNRVRLNQQLRILFRLRPSLTDIALGRALRNRW